MNPTVSIHDSTWDAINHTINWISNVLSGGYEQRSGYKDDNSGFVMQPEHIVVDPNMIKLQEIFQTWKEPEHDGVNRFLVWKQKNQATKID